MSLGLVGRKCGMTRIFTPEGASIPVTVIEIVVNTITQIKTVETDGYHSVQITSGSKSNAKVNKPLAGHFAKAGVAPGTAMQEFRLETPSDLKVGDQLAITLFEEGELVDVRALTKGKGFAGTVKRHHFRMQDATHGNSLSHRAPGSIGQRQTPGRVMKGKKMSGHLGDVFRTIQNQPIIKIEKERNLILVRGAIPGAPGGSVLVVKSVKKKKGGK